MLVLEQGKLRDGTRWLWVLGVINFALFLWLVSGTWAKFGAAPWTGPDVATVVLSAATVVLAVLAIGVALAGFWGYANLRNYISEVAKGEASIVAAAEANRILPELFNSWRVEAPKGDDVNQAYE